MKLRKLILHNVRRFAGRTAVLGPFGDGLTTVTAENESGKSTFFGALHALFFYDYGSGKKELKEMQPYSGGAMRIAAEIELDGTDYLIEKTFNLKKAGSSATVTAMESGTILKQADDAEHWLQQNILRINNGPFGLLWVRQGSVDVDASAEGIDTRRDVMSSVRGQIDAVTGGRRMDNIVQRCRQELDVISTKHDKPKAGSQWKDAVDRVELLRQEQDRLKALVTALSQDLEMKKRVSTRLRALHAPELRDLRTENITQAAAHLGATREHARKVQDAQKDLQLLQNAQQDIDRSVQSILGARKQRETIALEMTQKEQEAGNAQADKTRALEALNTLQDTITEKEKLRRSRNEVLKQIRQSERETTKRKRLASLSDLTRQLHAPKAQLHAAGAILNGAEITKNAIDGLDDLERRRDIAIEMRKVQFSRFTVSAETTSARIDGADVPNDVPRLIDRPVSVTLPGFGTMDLQPAKVAGQSIADPDALRAELTQELRALEFETIAQARHAYAARQEAAQDHQTAKMQIRALAPDGIDAIEQEWAELCEALNHPKDAPAVFETDGPHANITSETIEIEISNLDDDLGQLRQELPAFQDALGAATRKLTETEVILARLRAESAQLLVPADEAETLKTLVQDKTAKEGEVGQAKATFEGLQQAAPDLSAAIAAHERAMQADTEDKKEIHRLERDLARLDGAIHTQSEGAVEEKLQEVSGKLERAKDRAAQFANHVRALRLLIEHLEAARADAQETYFEPVRNELLPLLRQLHAGADLEIDPDKLLIETITRNGVTDKVDVLSGGAFEQIAILTRLAFARLFAKHGNHVPVILDDAMVHTDDERISTMFNMLAQIARGQQIIVLSCRTRAFSDLGGTRAFVTETREDAGLRD